MRIYFLLFLFFFGYLSSTNAIIFSEVMYDFPGTDTKHEWIEIYNEANTSLNLSNIILRESNNNHQLTLIQGNIFLNDYNYAIIADDATTFLLDYPNFNATLFDSTFTSGLNNNGEELILINALINTSLFYNTSIGAKGDNNTLSFINGTWRVGIATPGKENQLFVNNSEELINSSLPNFALSIYLDEIIYTQQEYDNLFKLNIENKDNCSKKDTILVYYNISGSNYFFQENFIKEIGCSSYSSTGNLKLETEGQYTLCGKITNSTLNESNYNDNSICFNFTVIDSQKVNCDISLEIINNNTLFYEQDQPVNFKFSLNNDTFPFQIEYWIEDLFGNTVKSKYNTNNLNQKSWKANIEEEDRILYLRAQLYPTCNDTNFSNNFAQKLILITNPYYEIISTGNDLSNNESWIKIIKITPEEPSFGELVKVEAEIHKGNTNRYSISAGVKKSDKNIGPETKINLESKYQTYKVTLPLWIDPNCNDKIKEGTAEVFIEGLGIITEEDISINGKDSSLCEIGSSSSSTALSDTPNNTKLSYSFLDFSPIHTADKPLIVKISLTGDEKSHQFKIWTYLYRGPKCYSCKESREENLQELSLSAQENKIATFELSLPEDIEEGEYSVKAEINRDHLKTNSEITSTLFINSLFEEKQTKSNSLTSFSSIESNSLNSENPVSNFLQFSNASKGIIVYQSTSEKSKELILYFLLISLSLLCFFFLKTNKKN